MANVLPPEAQKRVWAMYRSRLILVTSLALLVLSFAAGLTLIPSYVALEITAPAADLGPGMTESQRADAVTLERSQFLIRELKPVISATTSAVTVAESALAKKPKGIAITRVMYTRDTEEGRITFIGTGSRDQVSAYKDILASSGEFTGVAVPVGALVGSEGGGFSIVLVGDF